MDANQLTKVLRQADAVGSDAAEYRGLLLGTLLECWPEEVLSGKVGTMSREKSSGACGAHAYDFFLPKRQMSAGKPHNSWIRHTYQLNSCVREFHRSHSINSCRRSVLQWSSSAFVRLPINSGKTKRVEYLVCEACVKYGACLLSYTLAPLPQ